MRRKHMPAKGIVKHMYKVLDNGKKLITNKAAE
jgi:hypothetical protein